MAVLLAILMDDAAPKDIIGATAAYAAVLVVFVGTSGGSISAGSSTTSSTSGSSALSNGAIGGVVAGSMVGTFLLLILAVVVWISIVLRTPGLPMLIPGISNPRGDESGQRVASLLKQREQGRPVKELYV